MPTPTYSKTGTKASTAAKLNKEVFAVNTDNHDLMKQAYQTYLANGREKLAKTLKRGEVRGGGKKPWKQKGTGRARFGSIRVPIWRGGGITFGPLGKENYSKKMTKNAKRAAIKQALSVKSAANAIILMDDFTVSDGKTKTAQALLNKVSATGRILIAVETLDEKTVQALANINDVAVVQAQYLNVYTLLNANTVILTKKAQEIVETWLTNKEAK